MAHGCFYLSQDVKPGDISNKRGMWETKKGSAPAKVTHTHTHQFFCKGEEMSMFKRIYSNMNLFVCFIQST